MERAISLVGRSSSRTSEHLRDEPLLPSSEKPALRRPPISSFLGYCLYRRVVIWTILSLALVSIALLHASDVPVPDVVEYGKSKFSPGRPEAGGTTVVVTSEGDEAHGDGQDDGNDGVRPDHQNGDEEELTDDEKDQREFEQAVKNMPWLLFKQSVTRFSSGLQAANSRFTASMDIFTGSKHWFASRTTFPNIQIRRLTRHFRTRPSVPTNACRGRTIHIRT